MLSSSFTTDNSANSCQRIVCMVPCKGEKKTGIDTGSILPPFHWSSQVLAGKVIFAVMYCLHLLGVQWACTNIPCLERHQRRCFQPLIKRSSFQRQTSRTWKAMNLHLNSLSTLFSLFGNCCSTTFCFKQWMKCLIDGTRKLQWIPNEMQHFPAWPGKIYFIFKNIYNLPPAWKKYVEGKLITINYSRQATCGAGPIQSIYYQ